MRFFSAQENLYMRMRASERLCIVYGMVCAYEYEQWKNTVKIWRYILFCCVYRLGEEKANIPALIEPIKDKRKTQTAQGNLTYTEHSSAHKIPYNKLYHT